MNVSDPTELPAWLETSKAGYSSASLPKKLGLKPSTTLSLIGAPKRFVELLEPLPPGCSISEITNQASPAVLNSDFVVAFFTRVARLTELISPLREQIFPTGRLWICWPKKASKVPSEIDENLVQSLALRNSLVDIKVCAISDIWSGLLLVIPKEQRVDSTT